MSLPDYTDVEAWVACLLQCKQLPENDVKKLCDKVTIALGPLDSPCSLFFFLGFSRLGKYWSTSQMYSR